MAPQHLGDADGPWEQENLKGTFESRPNPDPNPTWGPARPRKKFVLCFDGTGNKFQGTDGDSNILKIFRMLDRQTDQQFHYYQPGIGTYVTSNSYSHTSLFSRINSWYQKAKDSAVGTSFDAHVMGGYKFLMRYYSPGDDIYFFGFSRGAYIARFLAEMLDYVGLLSAGNEELARFAWKTFSQWQQRTGGGEEAEEKKRELFRFMIAFRETFSRPVRRIRFLGLFDTVNSVPRFESAWMERSKFPYTARSSAKVIRHAVGIDERRAKFRQDLLSGEPPKPIEHKHHHYAEDAARKFSTWMKPGQGNDSSAATEKNADGMERYRGRARNPKDPRAGRPAERLGAENLSARYRPTSRRARSRARSSVESHRDFVSANGSQISLDVVHNRVHEDFSDSDSDDGDPQQDIKEVWFPGCHADIGGGWNLAKGEEFPLSHAPLVWMVREAQKAGLGLDEEKMRKLNCFNDKSVYSNSSPFDEKNFVPAPPVPQLTLSGAPLEDAVAADPEPQDQEALQPSQFERALELAATKGVNHDCLAYNNGLPHTSVLSWKIMEYLPFRRMDLQPDGSWSPIRWPLPRGEPRDVPNDAIIHNSVLKRMKANPDYRPGNIIVGGGGRGVRIAPGEYGSGEWVVVREEGDPVGEVVRRKHPPGWKPSPNGA